jgi:hypothetical protein
MPLPFKSPLTTLKLANQHVNRVLQKKIQKELLFCYRSYFILFFLLFIFNLFT